MKRPKATKKIKIKKITSPKKKKIIVSNKCQRHKVFVLGEVVGETRVSRSEWDFFPSYPKS